MHGKCIQAACRPRCGKRIRRDVPVLTVIVITLHNFRMGFTDNHNDVEQTRVPEFPIESSAPCRF